MMQTYILKTTKISIIALLVAEAATVTIPVVILGKYFNFPDILRQPAEKAFVLFRTNNLQIVSGYYVFLISSLLYIPLSFTIRKIFDETNCKLLMQSFTGLGIVTAVFQSIGFIRWIFTMPYLTDTYFAQTGSQQTVSIIYEMLNRYAGMSIGEHLGFIAMGSWTFILSIILIKINQIKKWLGYIGCIIGLLLIISTGEHFGGQTAKFFGTINFAANTIWTFWLLAIALEIGITSSREQGSR